ncbi:hypothetical protein JZ751_004050 [Albula glossodonta]|uniref:Uncharacterized protein n=1 Tax=Albula glossodonta TaxID=121402 RepID=A0A8T2P7Z9_9TELE|nr:hypothetical protein JZ751_004050 [Albula glossodonta]
MKVLDIEVHFYNDTGGLRSELPSALSHCFYSDGTTQGTAMLGNCSLSELCLFIHACSQASDMEHITSNGLQSSQGLMHSCCLFFLGKIRSAVGSAQLLMSQKFQQFRELCEENLNPNAHPRPISQDLAGFWDMLQLSIENISLKFDELHQLKANNWRPLELPERKSFHLARTVGPTPRCLCSLPHTRAHLGPAVVFSANLTQVCRCCLSSTPPPHPTPARLLNAGLPERRMPPPVPKKPPKGHPPLARDRSLESTERQRMEARKRLMAAKRAASVRQNSATESADSIEIYIPEAQTRL